jgi:hypothetical protein
MRLRDKAFLLAQNREAVGWLESGVDPANAPRVGPGTLTTDYLVESERMVDLMRDLAQKGLLATPQ